MDVPASIVESDESMRSGYPELAGLKPVRYCGCTTLGGQDMPAFGTRLTAEEIAAIVEYTRTVLGS